MKASVLTQFGPPEVLQLREVVQPTPKDNEVLVRVHASSVNFGDLMARDFKAVCPGRFNMPWLFWLIAKLTFGPDQPRVAILGCELAGEIEAVGKDVTLFKVGERVFGFTGQSFGAYAEYLCLPEDGVLAAMPANMSFEEAAVVPYGALMAFNLLRKVNLQPGQKVLVNGASGAIGSAAVQIAQHLGAQVTGVCATPRLGYVRSLGAGQVIDYTRQDFTQNGERYDLIFDILGKASYARCKDSLTPRGVLLYASFKTKQLAQMLWTSRSGGPRVVCALAPGSRADLLAIKELIEAGSLRPILDRSYPLAQAAEAHRYVESGEKRGSVAITIAAA